MELCEQASREQDGEKLLSLVKEINELLEAKNRIGPQKENGAGVHEQADGKSNVTCRVCGQGVALENARTDDDGRAVHEQCYLLRHQLKNATEN